MRRFAPAGASAGQLERPDRIPVMAPVIPPITGTVTGGG